VLLFAFGALQFNFSALAYGSEIDGCTYRGGSGQSYGRWQLVVWHDSLLGEGWGDFSLLGRLLMGEAVKRKRIGSGVIGRQILRVATNMSLPWQEEYLRACGPLIRRSVAQRHLDVIERE
jgi:hypothetical protein